MPSDRWLAPAAGLLAAVAFVALGSVRLDAQGAQYDSIHQVPAALTWIGFAPWWFCYAPVGGIPLFTMPYSGALKSALYGTYLALTGQGFDLWQWRFLGLVVAALGVGVLVAGSLRRSSRFGTVTLALLCLSDGALLMGGRYDYGPVAVGFALRAGILGLWLRDGARSVGSATAIGFLAGLAVYDKLHALAMLPAVVILLVASRGPAAARRWVGATAGFVVGIAPVLWIHARVWWSQGVLFALQGARPRLGSAAPSVAGYLHSLATLGTGSGERGMILGIQPATGCDTAEAICFGAAVLVIGWMAWRSRSLALGAAGAAWALVVLGLLLMPLPTTRHHWILATPWLYVALALALSAARGGIERRVATFVCVAWLATRLILLSGLERDLATGAASLDWHPNLSRFARHAAEHYPESPFVVAQWGLGLQLYAAGSGAPDRVMEMFWRPDELGPWLDKDPRSPLYLVHLEPNPYQSAPDATTRLLAELRARPDWVEARSSSDLLAFPPVRVWRFDRARVLDRAAAVP